MAGAYRGLGEPECVVNIGVSGPAVVKRAIERLRQSGEPLTLGDIAEEIRLTAFRVTRVGELIGREVAASWAPSLGSWTLAGADALGGRQRGRILRRWVCATLAARARPRRWRSSTML